MPPDQTRVEGWLDSETARLLDTVDMFRGRDLSERSALPDWSLAQLLTHIARNADALCNLLRWANTGIETPMYVSTEQRNDDINRGALRATAIIVDDVFAAAERFDAAMRSMSREGGQRRVKTAQGRTIPGSEIGWLRLREVVVHHVDLGAHFEDVDEAPIGELLNEVTAALQARPQWQSVAMRATDSPFAVVNGGPVVKGTSAQLLGWLTGRSNGGDLIVGSGGLPMLPSWL
jgi:maleylpyruvate isomerase